MVAKALKECRVCSCHELTNNSNGYCDKHIAIGKRVRNIDKKEILIDYCNERIEKLQPKG